MNRNQREQTLQGLKQQINNSVNSKFLKQLLVWEIFRLAKPTGTFSRACQEFDDPEFWSRYLEANIDNGLLFEERRNFLIPLIEKYEEFVIMSQDHYEALGVNRNDSTTKIKARYRKLSRESHPDRKKETEEILFKKFARAHEVLSDPLSRQRYNLGLGSHKDEKYYYRLGEEVFPVNSQGEDELNKEIDVDYVGKVFALVKAWLQEKRISRKEVENWVSSKEKVKASLNISALEPDKFLSERLKIDNLTSEGKIKYKENFVRNFRVLLEEIEHAALNKEDYEKEVERIKGLFNASTPEDSVKREELSIKGLMALENYEIDLKRMILMDPGNEKDEEERNEKTREKKRFFETLDEIEEEVKEIRNLKKEIFPRLKKQLKELISSDSFDWNEFVKELRDQDKWKISGQSILLYNEEEVKELVKEIREEVGGGESESEDEISEDEISEDEISEDEIKAITEYLDDLAFELAPTNRAEKNKSNLRWIKKNVLGPELNYETSLKEAKNWRQAEDIRAKAIRNICEIIRNNGGSDDTLTNRFKEILTNFADLLKKEIEIKAEITFTDLSAEQQNLLVVDFENGINDTAAKLTESKRKLLSDLISEGYTTDEESETESEERDSGGDEEDTTILAKFDYSSKTNLKCRFKQNKKYLSYRKVIDLLKNRDLELAASFEWALEHAKDELGGAYFWECVPVSQSTLNRTFEFVFTKSNELDSIKQDYSKFRGYIEEAQKKQNPEVLLTGEGDFPLATSFTSYSGNTLIIPLPEKEEDDSEKDFKDLSSFVSNANRLQKRDLWKEVANKLEKELATDGEPRWLSTHGLGVPYLHVRIDKEPVYYSFKEYKKFEETIEISEESEEETLSSVSGDIFSETESEHSSLFGEEEFEEPGSPKEKDWSNIDLAFEGEIGEDLKELWINNGFNYEEVQDWINIGIKVNHYEFCSWLKDEKNLSPEKALNELNGDDLDNLFNEYEIFYGRLSVEPHKFFGAEPEASPDEIKENFKEEILKWNPNNWKNILEKWGYECKDEENCGFYFEVETGESDSESDSGSEDSDYLKYERRHCCGRCRTVSWKVSDRFGAILDTYNSQSLETKKKIDENWEDFDFTEAVKIFQKELDDSLGGEFGLFYAQLYNLSEEEVDPFFIQLENEIKKIETQKKELVRFFVEELKVEEIAKEDQDQIQKLVNQAQELKRISSWLETTDEQEEVLEEKLAQLKTELTKKTKTPKKSRLTTKPTTDTKNQVNGWLGDHHIQAFFEKIQPEKKEGIVLVSPGAALAFLASAQKAVPRSWLWTDHSEFSPEMQEMPMTWYNEEEGQWEEAPGDPTEYVFIPVCHADLTVTEGEGRHWGLLVWDRQWGSFYYYDSSSEDPEYPKNARIIAEKITKFTGGKEITKFTGKSPRQTNDSDCGVYVCANAESLVKRVQGGFNVGECSEWERKEIKKRITEIRKELAEMGLETTDQRRGKSYKAIEIFLSNETRDRLKDYERIQNPTDLDDLNALERYINPYWRDSQELQALGVKNLQDLRTLTNYLLAFRDIGLEAREIFQNMNQRPWKNLTKINEILNVLALGPNKYQETASFIPKNGKFGKRDLTDQEKEFIDSCLSETALNELAEVFPKFFVKSDLEEYGFWEQRDLEEIKKFYEHDEAKPELVSIFIRNISAYENTGSFWKIYVGPELTEEGVAYQGKNYCDLMVDVSLLDEESIKELMENNVEIELKRRPWQVFVGNKNVLGIFDNEKLASVYERLWDSLKNEKLHNEVLDHLRKAKIIKYKESFEFETWLEEAEEAADPDFSRHLIVKEILDTIVPLRKALLEENETEIQNILNSGSYLSKELKEYFLKWTDLSRNICGQGFTKKEKAQIFFSNLGAIGSSKEIENLTSFLKKIKRIENARQEGKIETVNEEIQELKRYRDLNAHEWGADETIPTEAYHYHWINKKGRLDGLNEDLNFIHEFRVNKENQGITKEITDAEILTYRRAVGGITALEACQAFGNLWTAEQIGILDDGRWVVYFDRGYRCTNVDWTEVNLQDVYNFVFTQWGQGNNPQIEEGQRSLEGVDSEQWRAIYPNDPRRAREVFDRLWEIEEIRAPNEVEFYEERVNPLNEDKLTAYQRAFENAPGSTVAGNRHDELGGVVDIGGLALDWLLTKYPPTVARIAFDNGWNPEDVDNWEVVAHQNRAQIANGEPYSFDITRLLKNQARLSINARNVVNAHWNACPAYQAADNSINGQTKAEVLGPHWETNLQALDAEAAINARRDHLIRLIDIAAETETGDFFAFIEEAERENWRNDARQAVINHWNIQTTRVMPANTINGRTVNQVLGGDGWDNFAALNEQAAITNRQNVLIGLINAEHNNAIVAAAATHAGGGGGGGYHYAEADIGGGDEAEPAAQAPTTYGTATGTSTNYSSPSSSSASDSEGSETTSSSSSTGSYSGGGFSGGLGGFTSSGGSGGGGGGSSTSTPEAKPKKESAGSPTPTPATPSAPVAPKPTPTLASLIQAANQAEEKAEEIFNKPVEEVSMAEIEEALQKTEEIHHQIEAQEFEENPTPDSLSPEEKQQQQQQQMRERTSRAVLSLKVKRIEKTPNEQITQARKMAYEAITQYADELNVTNFSFNELESELGRLNTSQAVAHHVQETVKQIEQQKLQKVSLGPKPKSEKQWLPWAIGGGVLVAALAGTVTWYLNKIPTGLRGTKKPPKK